MVGIFFQTEITTEHAFKNALSFTPKEKKKKEAACLYLAFVKRLITLPIVR